MASTSTLPFFTSGVAIPTVDDFKYAGTGTSKTGVTNEIKWDELRKYHTVYTGEEEEDAEHRVCKALVSLLTGKKAEGASTIWDICSFFASLIKQASEIPDDNKAFDHARFKRGRVQMEKATEGLISALEALQALGSDSEAAMIELSKFVKTQSKACEIVEAAAALTEDEVLNGLDDEALQLHVASSAMLSPLWDFKEATQSA